MACIKVERFRYGIECLFFKNPSDLGHQQFRKMNMDHLLNKPYVDEVALTEQNLY